MNGWWSCPLPPTRGGLKLYTKGIKILLYDADANNYLSIVTVYGNTFNSYTQIATDGTDKSAQEEVVYTWGPTDCSGYDVVGAYVGCICDATEGAVDILGVLMDCYYAA